MSFLGWIKSLFKKKPRIGIPQPDRIILAGTNGTIAAGFYARGDNNFIGTSMGEEVGIDSGYFSRAGGESLLKGELAKRYIADSSKASKDSAKNAVIEEIRVLYGLPKTDAYTGSAEKFVDLSFDGERAVTGVWVDTYRSLLDRGYIAEDSNGYAVRTAKPVSEIKDRRDICGFVDMETLNDPLNNAGSPRLEAAIETATRFTDKDDGEMGHFQKKVLGLPMDTDGPWAKRRSLAEEAAQAYREGLIQLGKDLNKTAPLASQPPPSSAVKISLKRPKPFKAPVKPKKAKKK